MTKREFEKAIFENFNKVNPGFAGRAIKRWYQPEDEDSFPDVICELTSCERVGVELTEWLREDEMETAKRLEAIEASFRDAIGEQGGNETENIYNVWLKPKRGINANAAQRFRRELWQCIKDVDSRWPTEKFWQTSRGYEATHDDLKSYPGLMKYLDSIRFNPSWSYGDWPPRRIEKASWPLGLPWIDVRPEFRWFAFETMLQALFTILDAKLTHYGNSGVGFDRLCLIVHYDLALRYDRPVETPFLSLEKIAERARCYVEKVAGPFQDVFLFRAVGSGQVIKIL